MDAGDTTKNSKPTLKRSLQKRWYALWVITPALLLYPINNYFTRVATLLAVAGLYFGLLYFYWGKWAIRYIALSAAILCGGFLFLPSRTHSIDKLRKSYTDSLNSYVGTRYIWGGETRLGLDCSGLVRRGLMAAEFRNGILEFDPGMVRESIALWWNDCSARALGQEYQGRTHILFSGPTINDLDHARLLPGDIAVTTDGVHVLAYLGDKTWIEAEPLEKKVIEVHAPSQKPWFDEPVSILRWTILDQRLTNLPILRK